MGFGCVKAVFDEFSDGCEDGSGWIRETGDFSVAVEEVRGTDLLEGL